jgi:acetate kinase
MADAILVINAGSSSLKFSLFDVAPAAGDAADPLTLSVKGQIEGIGTSPHFVARDRDGAVLVERRWSDDASSDHAAFFRVVSDWLHERGADRLSAVGHRVVHGGPDLAAPVLVDDGILRQLDRLSALAPLHQPHNLAGIRAVAAVQPEVPQVACFDTAFHRGHPEVADWFALPRALHDEGVRRYGFHGLSYEYIARTLPKVAPEIAQGRVVVAHLGNGASMCALKAGRSIDSTMGFTALDGLVMGTRCGALDPGVVLHLMRAHGMDADAIEQLLYHQCGLEGVSGVSNDMRDLETSDDPHAAQAIALFVYRINRVLAALAAALEGLDGLVFTAGIGEHARENRARDCRHAAWLGIELHPAANQADGPRISSQTSKVSAWVVPTDEERMIARHTLALLGRGPGSTGEAA